jgi:hypothetical protein
LDDNPGILVVTRHAVLPFQRKVREDDVPPGAFHLFVLVGFEVVALEPRELRSVIGEVIEILSGGVEVGRVVRGRTL